MAFSPQLSKDEAIKNIIFLWIQPETIVQQKGILTVELKVGHLVA